MTEDWDNPIYKEPLVGGTYLRLMSREIHNYFQYTKSGERQAYVLILKMGEAPIFGTFVCRDFLRRQGRETINHLEGPLMIGILQVLSCLP